MKIIGRHKEQDKFQEFMNSESSEFVVVYGRRRIGKTFLIHEFFNKKFDFYHTGVTNSDKDTQLSEFNFALNQTSQKLPNTHVNSWFDAFHKLEFILENSNNKGKKLFSSMNCHGWVRKNRAFCRLWNCFGISGLLRETIFCS